MENDEYTAVSGGRHIRTTAISNFWPRNGKRGHLNNTTRNFFMVAGEYGIVILCRDILK